MKKLKQITLISVAILIIYFGYNYIISLKPIKNSLETSAVIEVFEKKLNEEKNEDETKGYDLEKTIRIIHGLESAKQNSKKTKDFLEYLAKQDYEDVANDVIKAKLKLIPILNVLQNEEENLNENEDIWNTFSKASNILLDEGSSIALKASISGGLDPSMAINLMNISSKTFSAINESKNISKSIKQKIKEIESDYIVYLNEFYPLYHKYMEEWDKVCLNRDNAYLSIHQGNIDSALISIEKALQINDTDSEALLMKTFCLLYKHQDKNEYFTEKLDVSYLENAKITIDKYLDTHPDKSAPALLLLGTYYLLNNEESLAINYYNQSAVEYPKQANLLLDMLNSYKQRSYLRKTAEGMYIVELYKSMMEGFGFYSPNFQKSLIAYNKGDYEESKEEIIRHFFRRGNQGVYDFLISDMNHCEKYLSESFELIFREKSFLNLVAETKTFNSEKLNIKIENKSDVKLDNVRVFLCIHFTDMYKDDYEVFKLENTINTINPNSIADFGDLEIDFSLYGKKKNLNEDVVTARAIILTDNLISWVDKEDFKIIKAKKSYQKGTNLEKLDDYLSVYDMNQNLLINEIISNSTYNIDKSYFGDDNFTLILPRNLVNYNPIFSISPLNNNNMIKPKSYILNGDNIEVTFPINLSKIKKIDFYINTDKFIVNWIFEISEDNKFKNSQINFL